MDSSWYVFACKEYSITFNVKDELRKGEFVIQKTWDYDQEIYHKFLPYWAYEFWYWCWRWEEVIFILLIVLSYFIGRWHMAKKISKAKPGC